MANERDASQRDLSPDTFGPLWEFVEDDNITDINLNRNGKDLWVVHLEKGKYRVENHGCDDIFVKQFTHRVRDHENVQFNPMNPILESETGRLRISCVHECVALSGTSICIRKSPPFIRMTRETALAEKYITAPVLNLLTNCVRAKMNFIFCGEPGVGKTECAKFFSQFIPAEDRVITIEDNLEFHYKEINPGKDCVELKVNLANDVFGYDKAIKACLRQNPQWIMLSEARSTEVKYLIECWSTGVSGFTTLHTDDVRKIPDRILNMLGSKQDAERLANDVFNFVDVGILLRKKKNSQGVLIRYVDQVCFFVREGNKNRVVMIVEDGEMVKTEIVDDKGKKQKIFQPLPPDVMKKMMFANISNPLKCSTDI